MNGLKFSLIAFPKDYELFFEQSIDHLCGAINWSSLCGITHFLSDNFDLYNNKFQQKILDTHLFVKELVAHYPEMLYMGDGQHYFSTVYFPHIKACQAADEEWLWEIIKETGVVFIPGFYSYYPHEMGFCFRLNLTLDGVHFRESLSRVLKVLSLFALKRNELRCEDIPFRPMKKENKSRITKK